MLNPTEFRLHPDGEGAALRPTYSSPRRLPYNQTS